jgi:hypothetical protein
MTATSLPASLLQKISATMDCLCQIALNWKLSRKFKKWCKFSSHVKVKLRKMKLRKMRTICIYFLLPHICHMSHPPHSPSPDKLNIWWAVKILKLSAMQFAEFQMPHSNFRKCVLRKSHTFPISVTKTVVLKHFPSVADFKFSIRTTKKTQLHLLLQQVTSTIILGKGQHYFWYINGCYNNLLRPFQKFCVWFYCNNKILDKNTIDILNVYTYVLYSM